MYKCLTRFHIQADHASPTYLGLGIIYIIIFHVYTSNALPYTRRTCIPRLFVVTNYLINYFVMYTRLTRFNIHPALASPTYLGLQII